MSRAFDVLRSGGQTEVYCSHSINLFPGHRDSWREFPRPLAGDRARDRGGVPQGRSAPTLRDALSPGPSLSSPLASHHTTLLSRARSAAPHGLNLLFLYSFTRLRLRQRHHDREHRVTTLSRRRHARCSSAARCPARAHEPEREVAELDGGGHQGRRPPAAAAPQGQAGHAAKSPTSSTRSRTSAMRPARCAGLPHQI